MPCSVAASRFAPGPTIRPSAGPPTGDGCCCCCCCCISGDRIANSRPKSHTQGKGTVSLGRPPGGPVSRRASSASVRPRRTAAGAALISHAPCCTSRCSRCCCCCCCDVSRRRLCNSPDSLWLAVELNSRPGLRTSLNYWKGIASPLVGRQMEKKNILPHIDLRINETNIASKSPIFHSARRKLTNKNIPRRKNHAFRQLLEPHCILHYFYFCGCYLSSTSSLPLLDRRKEMEIAWCDIWRLKVNRR